MYFEERRVRYRCVSNLWGTAGEEFPSLDAFKRRILRMGYAPPKVSFDPELGAWVVKAYFVRLEESLGRPSLIYEGDPRFKASTWRAKGQKTFPVLVEVSTQESKNITGEPS
ncbi:MAG: hypothetical protein QXY39_06050 [Thermofilaceae archaeon]